MRMKSFRKKYKTVNGYNKITKQRKPAKHVEEEA